MNFLSLHFSDPRLSFKNSVVFTRTVSENKILETFRLAEMIQDEIGRNFIFFLGRGDKSRGKTRLHKTRIERREKRFSFFFFFASDRYTEIDRVVN